jgi:hypothetical protein
VRIEGGFIEMVLHWQGGDHTALKLKMNGAGKHRWSPKPAREANALLVVLRAVEQPAAAALLPGSPFTTRKRS